MHGVKSITRKPLHVHLNKLSGKNSYIKCDINIIYYKEWHEEGIKEHIYDYRSKPFYNFNNLQNLYDLEITDFLKYHHIINNIYT